MRYVKFLLVPMLFISFTFMNIGGFGGCGGQPTNPPPTGTPPTNQPPSAYQIPALNTNFSDEGCFFFDDFTGFTIGVTSDGADVAIVIIDSTGTSIGAIAFPLDSFACIIDIGVIGKAAFDA